MKHLLKRAISLQLVLIASGAIFTGQGFLAQALRLPGSLHLRCGAGATASRGAYQAHVSWSLTDSLELKCEQLNIRTLRRFIVPRHLLR